MSDVLQAASTEAIYADHPIVVEKKPLPEMAIGKPARDEGALLLRHRLGQSLLTAHRAACNLVRRNPGDLKHVEDSASFLASFLEPLA